MTLEVEDVLHSTLPRPRSGKVRSPLPPYHHHSVPQSRYSAPSTGADAAGETAAAPGKYVNSAREPSAVRPGHGYIASGPRCRAAVEEGYDRSWSHERSG